MNVEKVLGIALLIIIIASVSVIIARKMKDKEEYFIYEGVNGDYRIDIIPIGNVTSYYVYSLTGGTVYRTPLRSSPYDVESVPLEPDLLDKLNKPERLEMVYITQDYETANKTGQMSIIALGDIGKILGNSALSLYKLPVKGALTSSSERSNDLEVPEISCDDVSDTVAVIYLKAGEENKVYSEEDCIIIEGRGSEGMTLAANKFTYYLLGVF